MSRAGSVGGFNLKTREMKELAVALESLFELDRMSGCSDRYFRQVCTAKINAIRAAGFREELLRAAAALEFAENNKEE